MDRGDLNAGRTGISGTPLREENFNYDPTGNWHGTTSGYITKSNGTVDLDQKNRKVKRGQKGGQSKR